MRDYEKLTRDLIPMMIAKMKNREKYGAWNTGNHSGDMQRIVRHLSKEVIELHHALDTGTEADIIDECIDVINLSAMLIDVVRDYADTN